MNIEREKNKEMLQHSCSDEWQHESETLFHSARNDDDCHRHKGLSFFGLCLFRKCWFKWSNNVDADNADDHVIIVILICQLMKSHYVFCRCLATASAGKNGKFCIFYNCRVPFIRTAGILTRLTQPSTTLRGTVKWVVTHLHGLRKVGTLVQLTGVA